MKLLCVAAAAAVCAVLSACGAPPAAPPALPAPPAPPPEPVDGTYRGTSTRFQADSKICPHPGLVTLQVLENRFQYRWDYRTFVDSQVAPDGSVQGQGPGITLIGKRDGKKIEGDVTNGACGLHFTVLRRDEPAAPQR